MTESSQIIRQWALVRRLSESRRGLTVRELVHELDTPEKTVRRDLDDLREVGFPLCETVEDHGRKRFRLASQNELPQLQFTFDEALALYLARNFLASLKGTLFWESLEQAFRKIRACFSDAAAGYVDRMSAAVFTTNSKRTDYGPKQDLVDRLLIAVEDRKQTIITYRSRRSTEPVEHAVYPLAMPIHKGSIYLIAHSESHGEIRTFKVDRIDDVEMTNLPFELPYEFDLEEHLRGSFGIFHGKGEVAVRARFAPQVARYVEESTMHPSQVLQREKSGALLAAWRLSAVEEIYSWLLSFGCQVEILEPESLREKAKDEVSRLCQIYATPVKFENETSERNTYSSTRGRKSTARQPAKRAGRRE